jgi:FG-GAP-like repeat
VLGDWAASFPTDPVPGSRVVFGSISGWNSASSLQLPNPQGINYADSTVLSIAVSDFNKDSRPDLLLNFTDRYKTRGMQILLNNGLREFTDASATYLGSEAYVPGSPSGTLYVVDINGDGCEDIVEPEATLDFTANGRWLMSDCSGRFVNAATVVAPAVGRVATLLPFTDHTGRTSFYMPLDEPPVGDSKLHGTRYFVLRNLWNLPTPVGGQIRF